ncbi:hypothetical protein K502DRAFT_168507 [Neoconidiobolus thromboides FSU 785]|nr:hypothetical protein K502DRAFT_168507 [Neoconidiobolus thromboides FSU 785]
MIYMLNLLCFSEEEDQSIYLNHTELMINKLKDMKLAQVETYLSKKKKSYQLKLQQNQLTTKNNQLPIENMKKLIININEFKLEKGSLEFNIKLLKNSIKWKNSIKLDEFIKLQKKLFKEKSLDLDSLLLYFCNSKINNQFKFRLFLILVYYLYLNHYKNSYSQENNNNNNNLMDLNTFLTFNNFNHLLHFFPLNEKQFCILTNFYNLLISNNINNNDITNINTDATTTDNKDEIKDNNNNTLLQEYFLLIEQWLKENIPTEINLNLLFNTTTTVLTSAKTSTTSSFSNYKITQLFLNLMTNKLNLMNYPIYGEDNKTNIKNKTLKVYKPLFTYGKKQTLIQHKLHQLRDLRVTIGAKYSSKYQFYSTQNENNLTNYHDMIILFLTSNFTFVEYQLLSKLAINNNILLLCGTSNMCNFDQFNYQLQNLN